MSLGRKNLLWYILGALFVALIFIWYAVFSEERRDVLTVAFLDVGQGDAIFIEAPNGNQMLIDGGGSSKVLRALSDVLPFYDRFIDVLVATHPDKDHIGGLPDVLRRYKTAYVIEPGAVSDTAVSAEFFRLIESLGVPKVVARRGMKIILDDDVYALVLFPDRDVSGLESNDASIVVKLVYGNTSFLLTGDAPQKIENFLASLDGENLDVDVLKAGHHGSKTSTGELLLGFASPALAVISSGKENRYGHPHQEVLEKLQKFGTETFRTDEAGTIIFYSDGKKVFKK